jgi:hypothetical protein
MLWRKQGMAMLEGFDQMSANDIVMISYSCVVRVVYYLQVDFLMRQALCLSPLKDFVLLHSKDKVRTKSSFFEAL